ncbi:Uncharacterised protein [Cedecea lapagei]|uniref:Uncharacterized protein n=1 Tax=Cedecea lapagei TaxID=158823 RepID=A0A3S4J3B7_9ENTR|nr:hypothetical protein [Cedecea lapagei]VEB98307.1 Uncharacterised protein [Cedecea lapagei]
MHPLLRYTFVLLTIVTLNGCTLARVSESGHAKEVNNLHAVGLSLDTARQKALQDGFSCDAPKSNISVQIDGIVRKSTTLECGKKSPEVFCPQYRYVIFNADANSQIIYAVGKRIDPHRCF